MQKSLFTFLSLVVVTISQAFGQRLVSDAKIVYNIHSSNQSPADSLFAAGKLTQYMKGFQSRVDIDFTDVHISYLINSKDQTVVTLINNNDQIRYLTRAGKEEYEKELKLYAAAQFKDANETKKIAGYNCKKAIAKLPDGSTFEVYYTADLIPENKQYNRRFVNLKGMPLQFEILNKNGLKMTMEAVSVELNAIPGSYFDAPKTGYKEISRDELAKMGN